MTNYFHFTADADGALTAELPDSLPHGAVHISATDSTPDPTNETGVRWTNTATITW